MTDLLTSLTDGFGPTVLVAAFVFALAESACGLGSLLPGEAAILALATAASGPGETVLLGVAVALGATAGDHVGYAIGRRHAGTVRDSRLVVRIGVRHWDRASDLVRRYGAVALVVSRLLPVVRTLTPPVAGASGLGYRSLLAASALGSALWAGLWVGAGAAAGSLVGEVARDPARALPYVVPVVLVALAVALGVRGRRQEVGRLRAAPRRDA